MNDDLGPVLSTHKGRLAAGGYFWWVGGLAGVFGAYRAITGSIGGDWALAGQGVTGVLFGLALAIYPSFLLLQTLTAHQHGFVWTRLLRAPVRVRWSDVANVSVRTEHDRRALHMKGANVELDITLRDGRHVFVTNDLEGIEQIQGYLARGAQAATAAPTSAWGPPPAGGGAGAPPSPWG